MISSETDIIIKELFESFLERYEERLEESMRGSKFIFVRVHALYYDLNKIDSSRSESYIDFLE